MKVYVVVALYYPSYYEKVQKSIESIFDDNSYELVYVDNSTENISHRSINRKELWIKGSNVGGEFSAWDEGYDYINENYTLFPDDVFLFLNDTFCHHHYFTFYDKFLYRKVIKNCREKNIFGELNGVKKEFAINNYIFSKWVSSYILILTKSSVDKLLPFNKVSSIDEIVLDDIKSKLSDNQVIVPFFSESLNVHLTNWLFPTDNNGWYNAKKGNLDIYMFKLKAIMNEKFITYSALKNDLIINDIYAIKYSRIYNSIRTRLYEFNRRRKVVG
ncbi:hypothetical protein RJ498_002114 [Pluralibacter gergoviae]